MLTSGSRGRTIFLGLVTALLVLLPQCAPRGMHLMSFHDTDQYQYLPFDMDGDSRIDYVQRLDKTLGWKNAFYFDQNKDGYFEKEVDLTRLHIDNRVHIVFAVDGFPHRYMEQLRKEGYYLLFRYMSKMVAPFPSLTGVSWPRILGEPPPAGYEATYFNQKANRIEKEPGGHVFPQSNKIIGKLGHAWAYVQAGSYAETEIKDRYETALKMKEKKKKIILLYFLSTDAAGHRMKEPEYRELLITLNNMIEKLFYEYGARCRISIVSDHGNNRNVGTYVDVVTPLKDAGFNETDSLESPEDFVCPRYGMIGIADIYTDYQNAEPMAGILSKTEGVNFVVYWSPGGIIIVSDRGTARIQWRKRRFRHDIFGLFSFLFSKEREYLYEPVTGDPLLLTALTEKIPELSVNRFCRETDWFKATENFQYPDPLRRIFDSFENDVRNPATLLVDIEDRYFSSGQIHLVAHSTGTHGNLGALSSLGILGTNWCELPPAVDADEVNKWLHVNLKRLKKKEQKK